MTSTARSSREAFTSRPRRPISARCGACSPPIPRPPRRDGGPLPVGAAALPRLRAARPARLPGQRSSAAARLLLDAGADPNAGYLWHGLPTPFTALTGAFGEGELGPVRQPRHPHSLALARLLLEAGADPNDGQALYNRMFEPGNDHLELLLEFGLGTGDGGPWRRTARRRARASGRDGPRASSPGRSRTAGRTGSGCSSTTASTWPRRSRTESRRRRWPRPPGTASSSTTWSSTAPRPSSWPRPTRSSPPRSPPTGQRMDQLLAGAPGARRPGAPASVPRSSPGRRRAGQPPPVELLAELGFDVNATRADRRAERPALADGAAQGGRGRERWNWPATLLRARRRPGHPRRSGSTRPRSAGRGTSAGQALIKLLEPVTQPDTAVTDRAE